MSSLNISPCPYNSNRDYADGDIIFHNNKFYRVKLSFTSSDWETDKPNLDELSGDGSFSYTNPNPMPSKVGGYNAGTSFDNVSAEDMFTGLLYEYQVPQITSFTVKPNSLEIGQNLTSPVSLSWNTSNQNNIKNIDLYFDNKLLLEGVEKQISNKQVTIDTVSLTSIGSKNFELRLTDSKDSLVRKSSSVSWLNLMYYGVSNKEVLIVDDIKLLNKKLINSILGVYSFEPGYKYFIFPNTFTFNKIIDNNTGYNLDYIYLDDVAFSNDYNVSQTFKVIRSTYLLNGKLDLKIL